MLMQEEVDTGLDAMLSRCVHSVNKYLLSCCHMPCTVPGNVDKTVRKNSLSSGAHSPVECGIAMVMMLTQWFAALAGPCIFQVICMPSDG